MNRSDDIGQLAAALATAQGQIRAATKDKINPHFKNSYADLASVWDACRAQLSANELAVIQTFDNDGGQINLVTTLAHKSGQWISSNLQFAVTSEAGRNSMQSLGSNITYARRYALAAIVGVAPDDDDDAQSAMPAMPAAATAKRGNGNTPPEPPAEDPTIKRQHQIGVCIANTEEWLREHDINPSRECRLFCASKLLKRPVTTYNELTPSEAGHVLSLLDNLSLESITTLQNKYPEPVEITDTEPDALLDVPSSDAVIGPGH